MQERLQQLEGQMSLKERELQRLKAETEAIDSDRARTEEEKKKMRAAFEEKVESVQRQLMQLQKQLKEGEAAKVHPNPTQVNINFSEQQKLSNTGLCGTEVALGGRSSRGDNST